MGGHVFSKSSPIAKENIESTLQKFREMMLSIFPNAKNYFTKFITLGSVGKKDFSGDIDLAFDDSSLDTIEWDLFDDLVYEDYKVFKRRARTATDRQIWKRAILTGICNELKKKGIVCEDKATGNGMISVQFSQFNKEGKQLTKNGFPLKVQIDMIFGNIEWLKFAYYSDVYKDNVKGLHRSQLILHMFTYKGYSFSHTLGVMNKTTREILADTPESAIEFLNKLYGISLSQDILSNYFSLQEYINKNLKIDDLNGIYDIYLKTLDSTRCDIPYDMQDYWKYNKARLDLKGKFLPNDSKLLEFIQ